MRFNFSTDDTIAAIASPPFPAARGIIRISGTEVFRCLERLFIPADPADRPSTSLRRARMFHGNWDLGDQRLVASQVLLWPDIRSYTRQPSAEIHLPGSLPVLNRVLRLVCENGVRLAQPGEFTLRAFLSGRIDLTQAEAVLGVIDARGKDQFQVAIRQLAGGLHNPFSTIRSQLLDLLADIEAGLDFVDEDIEFVSQEVVLETLGKTLKLTSDLLSQMDSRGESHGLPSVVLLGHPNAGKSSLFNRLINEPLALESPVAGTTRDFLTARIKLAGKTLLLVDTAGLDGGPDADERASSIERQSQAFSREQVAAADLQVICLDATRPLTSWESEMLANAANRAMLVVETKTDLTPARPLVSNAVRISARTGDGIAELLEQIVVRLQHLDQNQNCLVSTQIRCRESAVRAKNALIEARQIAEQRWGEELLATELRNALDAIGEIVGAVHNDEVLDRLFSRFCIGK